ncbi:MAG: lipase/acyltransferase domain-containing protein, partial [Burkholderiales bacterium]
MKPFLISLLLLSLLLAACAEMIRPDFKRLYQMSERNTEQPPVIVVPGLFGSKLRNRATGAEVWPGSTLDIVFSNYESIGLEIDPDTLLPKPSPLEAYAITEGALGRDFYGEIIKTLSRYGGYARGEPGVPVMTKGPRYYLFPYDWRQDNVQTARQLDQLIEQIRRDYNDPALKVDIIAHSMGGLVVRYYLRYGTVDVLDGNDFPANHHGAKRIRRFIMLGTPNLGSVSSLHSLLKGYRVGLGSIPTEVLATMPSVYQLFPHPIVDWLITVKGEP